jgi:Trypsin-co-occurring domain 1
MTELVRVPLEGGEFIVAEVDKAEIPNGDVILAAPEPGKALAEMQTKLDVSLRRIRPAVTELVETLKGSGPDSFCIEFGVKIGGETGVILAKGTAEVNFKISMEWNKSAAGEATGGS